MTDDELDAWMQEELDNGELNFSSPPQCRVCSDPAVMGLVNKLLACGYTLPDILDALVDQNAKLVEDGRSPITKASLYRHRRRHFNVQEPAGALYRQIQERCAQNMGQDWKDGVGTHLNAFSVLETVMVKGYEQLVDPETKVDYKDAVRASIELYKLSQSSEDASAVARMRAEMGRVIEVVRTFVPEERWPAIQAALKGEAPVRQEPRPVEGSVRMIDIDDDSSEEE